MSKPRVIEVYDDRFIATVMQVLERDEEGRPRVLRAMYEGETAKLEGGEEFTVAYVNEVMLIREAEGRGKGQVN